MRRLVAACVAACVATALAVVGWVGGPARADVPASTPLLEIGATASGASRFTEGLHDRRALPRYTPSLEELVSRHVVPLENARASPITGSDYETYGFDTAGPLVVGTTYRVALRVTTVGHFDCSGYDDNGCTWRRPTDLTYQWTFVHRGLQPARGTPYYSPVTSTSSLQAGSWRRGTGAARFSARVVVSPLCLCRTATVEGLLRGRWTPLRTTGELGVVTLRVPYAVRRVRLVTAAATTTRADGGTTTFAATTSPSIAVPRQPG